MKNPFYLIPGMFFGFVAVKSEIISWFRIQEMFRLDSFHMYGVIGGAVITGALFVFLIKKFSVKTVTGEKVSFEDKKFHKGMVFGGLLFGIGWALTGACPGPLYAQVGAGYGVAFISLLSAIVGTFAYGALRSKLPH